MTTAKEKLVKRLLEGSDDIFTEFAIVGLEDSLETICNAVERIVEMSRLNDKQFEDLSALYYDGKAHVRVLQYFTGGDYLEQTELLNNSFDKLRGYLF